MSSIKTTELEGDVSIGRHVGIGGNVNVQGNTLIKKNLRVEGWLDAKNIKAPGKGVFTTIESLKEAYPDGTLPEGCWAIVGGTLPGELWYVNGGVWIDSGKTAGSVTVDMESYMQDLSTVQDDINSLKGDVDTINKKNDSQDTNIGTAQALANSNSALITTLRTYLTKESQDRASADTDLQGKINTEVSERKSADDNLKTADNTLQKNIDALAKAGYLYMGIANLDTNPGTPTQNVFWIAATKGSYSNFPTGRLIAATDDSGTTTQELISLEEGEVAILTYTGYVAKSDATANVVGWSKQLLPITFKTELDALESQLTNEMTDRRDSESKINDNLLQLEQENCARDSIVFDAFLEDDITLESIGIVIKEGATYKVYYSTANKCFVIYTGGKYYNSWSEVDDYMSKLTPYQNKIYIDGSQNIPYRWNGTELVPIAARASAASIYNPTVETGSYYVLCDTEDTTHSAVHVAMANKKATVGLMITFAIKKGTWKTYQYIGANTDENNWYDTDNWKDFGSMAQGSEAMIDIDRIAPLSTGYYALGTALSALKSYQETTGVNYQKRGLVISYSTEANKVETKQFQGDSIADFWEASLWNDFGGGSKLVASDTMADGGTDAFSTGGAYKVVPTEIEATEDNGSVSVKLKNKAGDTLSETQFSVGTGTGGGGGTTLAINFENDPFYVRAGGTAILKAAIRSVTQLADGSTQDNKIASVVFTNRTTKTVVASFKPNQASSSSLQAFNFEFDLTTIAANAGSTELQAVATDATGKTATRNVEMIAVDVTVESSQTLNYTKDTSLQVGGSKVSIPMYRFPHNASDKGIQTKIEIYKNSAWETLESVLVKDTYTHNVTIDPTGLGHGAYPLRIQGTDVASGLQGNILHTAVMVIEQRESVSDYNKPIVVARWYDDSDGQVKLFQTISFDVACYQRDNANPTVEVTVTDVTKGTTETVASKTMNRSSYYACEKRIVGYLDGDTLTFDAICGEATLTEKPSMVISGSLLDIAETEGAYYKISLAGRSNDDIEKSIKATASDGTTVQINVSGSNYSTNGFVADNFGTEKTEGRMALRVAENVTAECTDKPFANNAIPTNGMALSMTFKVKNIADRDAKIIKCMGDKLGFVLTGEKFIVTTAGESSDALKNVMTTAATSYLDDTVYRIDIVIEPQARAPYSGIMLCKVYQNGDESACVPIDTTNGFPNFEDTIHFDGTDADLYLYEIVRWNSYYDFIQAFNNYIVNITDTQAMLTEYEQNQVMTDVTAEGNTKPRPDMQKLLDRGIMVVAMTRTSDKNLSSDGRAVADSKIYYPDYIEPLKDKKTTVLMDLYLYFPDRPWANCKVEAVPGTNQGTSTLAYPVKNKKFKFKKCLRITMLYTREQISEMYNADESILAKYDDAAKLAKKKKIRIKEGSTPINTITIKVDYSDSAGANNCALMELMNDTQRALGPDYMTPAQRYNTDTSETLQSSIDGVTCALFRTDYKIGQDKGAEAATLPENAYFHSKANFNADKGNPHFFGFEDVAGYNLGCVNYGDFKEIVTPRGTAIDDYKATVLSNTDTLVPGTLYMISEFCGPETRFIENDGTGTMTEIDAVAVDDDHTLAKTLAEVQADDVSNYDWGEAYKTSDGKYVQYKGGKWIDTTGSMTFDAATKKWSIVGRVLNPVECYEYRQYQEFCWQQGVNSVDDMLKTLHTDDGDVPIWSTYYEMRYPDDDDLNALYAAGKKVPYQLYRELAFCQQCNQNLTDDATANAATNDDGSEKIFNGAGASTTITLDGQTVAGTKENRLLKWQHEMHNYFSPQSTNCYVVTSDYKATVDQRAKNMMAAVYKESDGKMRFYFNHWYDGDSCDEADNDCYLTIPWDMDGATSHLYQGWDGVMFQQCYALFEKGEGLWLDDSGTSTLTLHDTAAAMRATKTSTGLDIFSADGCYRYWMTSRILKWPKVVSSFDGERKYIETATAADNHYPALHGLRLESLPAFQRKRFAFRDGYYQTGDLFTKFFQARMMGAINVKITAAQDGYFGMGVDSTSSAKYACYLKAGESYTFTDAAAGEGGKLIYIFGADKIATLDISGCTPKNSNWMIADCTLLRKLIIGGESYTPAYTTDILSTLNLGQMPFLEEVDIRNTKITSVNASLCPRLKSILAKGSLLQTFTPAEACPLQTAQLPETMVDVRFVNMPKVTYPDGGLTFEGYSNIKNLVLSGCANIDMPKLLGDVVNGGAKLTAVSIKGLRTTSSPDILTALKDAGTIGIGSDNKTVCDGLQGRWICSTYVEAETFAALTSYFTSLELLNSQFSTIRIDDVVDNDSCAKYSNEENKTGYKYGNDYVPSAHVLAIRQGTHAYKCTYNEKLKQLEGVQISDTNFNYLADGSSFDNTDTAGEGFDIMWHAPHHWYKGVNDYKNQVKYIFYSTTDNEPISTANIRKSYKLSELLYAENMGVYVDETTVGQDIGSNVMATTSNTNAYRMDVEGMKQVRWPGLNHARLGGVFTDADGKVLGTFNMSVSNTYFDFTIGNYVFCDVPAGAKYFYFTAYRDIDDMDCIAVDSDNVEAIEPEWTEHKVGDEDSLVGIYPITIDSLKMPRSVSGAVKSKKGDGNSTTSTEWALDKDGNPTVMPTGTIHYTCKDFQNSTRMRGAGYQLQDYEQHKEISNLWWALHGTTNEQSIVSNGAHDATLNSLDTIGMSDSSYNGNQMNSIMGLKHYVGCDSEWMDYIACNVQSYDSFYKNKCIEASADPVDYKAHIYDPIAKTERVVQTVTSNANCVVRVVHGAKCDILASKVHQTDTSLYTTHYATGMWLPGSKGRCVLRSGGGSFARARAALPRSRARASVGAWPSAENSSLSDSAERGNEKSVRGRTDRRKVAPSPFFSRRATIFFAFFEDCYITYCING